MKAESKLSRLALVSPWFPLIFLVIPLSVILSITFHVRIPLAGYKPLLINNSCFALLIALRFVYNLLTLRKPIRYGSWYRRPRQSETFSRPVADVRETLSTAGYRFDASGNYGEKRDSGYLGTTLIYGGILMLLFTGVWDSLRQFSGTLLDGVGIATKLNNVEIYQVLKKGPLTPKPEELPRMQVIKQFLPDAKYPDGATEILLVSKDNKEQLRTLKPGERFTYRDYEIYMSRMLFEPILMVRTKDSNIVFNGPVKLNRLAQRQGNFDYYGQAVVDRMYVDAYYQPEQGLLKVVIKNRDKLILDAGMHFQLDQKVVQGGLVLTCEKMGQWSEIQVVRKRHSGLMVMWGLVAAAGALLRIVFSAQRVWLEEDEAGCRVWAVGKETGNLMRDEG
ncbi:MAG: hypothetical protein JJE30_01070 [Desulfuromonadales bacterium]|nr:hypothetical protein [Desulfuromonadales bacterium]